MQSHTSILFPNSSFDHQAADREIHNSVCVIIVSDVYRTEWSVHGFFLYVANIQKTKRNKNKHAREVASRNNKYDRSGRREIE